MQNKRVKSVLQRLQSLLTDSSMISRCGDDGRYKMKKVQDKSTNKESILKRKKMNSSTLKFMYLVSPVPWPYMKHH